MIHKILGSKVLGVKPAIIVKLIDEFTDNAVAYCCPSLIGSQLHNYKICNLVREKEKGTGHFCVFMIPVLLIMEGSNGLNLPTYNSIFIFI